MFIFCIAETGAGAEINEQCCGSGMFIPDPGSRIRVFPIPDPGSRISDPGSRIPKNMGR